MLKKRTSVMVEDRFDEPIARMKEEHGKGFTEVINEALTIYFEREHPMVMARDVYMKIGYDRFIDLLNQAEGSTSDAFSNYQ